MFGRIGLPELVLILAIALIIFGPRKLPEIGKSIGKGLREFRQATSEVKKSVSVDDSYEEDRADEKTKKHKEESPSEVIEGDIEAGTSDNTAVESELGEVSEDTDDEKV